MKLGNFVEVSVSVTDVMKSLTFYERLGFTKLDQSWEPWPWVVLTDGKVTLNLSQYSVPSKPIISYIADQMYRKVDELRKLGYEMTPFLDREMPGVQGMITPGGIGLALIDHSTRKISTPSGQSMCRCGEFAELSFPIEDLRKALDFWLVVGFEVQKSGDRPIPWASITDGLLNMGFYQTDEISEAGLTYYSEDTKERIETLKEGGYRFQKELPSLFSGLGVAVLKTPDKNLSIYMEKAPSSS